VVAVITFILASVALIAVLAIVVGIADAAQRPAARRRAAERRERWEARQLTYHGPADEAWDED
jgi:hypothetical protein